MGRNLVRSSLVVPFLSLLFVVTLPALAGAQQTTGVIRGGVNAVDGQAVGTVEVTAANTATGVRTTTLSTAAGIYVFPSLPVGIYSIEARRIGYRAQVRENIRVTLGSTQLVNFVLEVGAAELAPITVTAEQGLIDPDQTGTVDLVSAEQIEAIPVAGRNFSDLAALSPRVSVSAGDGTGGNLSLGGGRRGANLIQIDGAGSTGTFFGGEARGSDRIPFAFSIESVEEFQVVANGFDVEFGFFSGGVINAVTKSGTNEFHGSAFGYFRDGEFTGSDFFDRPAPDFQSRQLGLTLSGPIIRDKVHFFVAVERQDRDVPVFGLPLPTDDPDINLRAHPDSVARFLDILSNVYGIEDMTGPLPQTQDETTIFGRIDWQLSNDHRLTLRHNYTDLDQAGDRLSSNETHLNAGVFNNTGNSTVASLTSVFSPTVWNEFKVQYATEPRPREANSNLPQIEVFLDNEFADGTRSTDFEAANDPVLPNNLEETTWEIVNNLHWTTGDHDLKLGVHFNNFEYLNFFFFNQFGEFEFTSLEEFENRDADEFSRSLPNPGPDGQFFTADDVQPLAEYTTREFGFYVQDSWRASNRLTLTGGLRFDMTTIPDAAPLNEDLVSSVLGIRTDITPEDNNLSPRISFAYDPTGNGDSQLRGGIGLFFGRFPSVLYSNSLLNTGGNQLSLFCDDDEVPTPDYQAFAADPSSIPVACAGGGAASPPTPTINSFGEEFEYPRTWKASLGYDRIIADGLRLSLDGLYSTTSQNFAVENRNLINEQFRTAIENRPVFAPRNRIDPGDGERFSSRDYRIDDDFFDALVHTSTAASRSVQLTLGLNKRMTNWLSWSFGYTFSDSKDNASYSCCISSTYFFETPTAGNPNFLGERGDDVEGSWGESDFNRLHTFVLSGVADLPAGFEVSGIWRAFSGRPWTPVVDGNPNSDHTDNDRAYIIDPRNPADLVLLEDPSDAALLESIYADHACLRKNVGRIIGRNACRNDMFTKLDMRFKWRGEVMDGQSIELIADLFNVLNFINDDWSRNTGISQFGSERELLELEGYNPVTNTHIYSVNPSFGEESDLTGGFRIDQWSWQLGAKVLF